MAIAIACNLIGAQAFVTQQNVDRAINPDLVAAGGISGLDVDYVSSLGADAARVLAVSRNNLPSELLPVVDAGLMDARIQLTVDAQSGWPSWNYSRQRALDTLISVGY